MQFWFARGNNIAIREQLVTQVVLAILSNDLAPGQRLPSTRELARRFRLHPNTISSGYRQLEKERWVEFRHGSGVYVCDRKPGLAPSPEFALDQLILQLFRVARESGMPLAAFRSRLSYWLEMQPPDHFLLIEPNDELRQILVAEMAQAVAFPVRNCSLQDCPKNLNGAIPVVLPHRAAAVRRDLAQDADLLILQVRSVPTSLADWLPAPLGKLIGVASIWPDFLKLARTVLQAAGFDPDALLFRDARKTNWQRGLQQTAAVVCDTVTAKLLPKRCSAIPFPLLSESSIAELSRYVEFIQNPLRS
jgi:GntR family transcriptional regulator